MLSEANGQQFEFPHFRRLAHRQLRVKLKGHLDGARRHYGRGEGLGHPGLRGNQIGLSRGNRIRERAIQHVAHVATRGERLRLDEQLPTEVGVRIELSAKRKRFGLEFSRVRSRGKQRLEGPRSAKGRHGTKENKDLK
jgi:hypothetical protein